MADAKTKPTPDDVEAHIAALPDARRADARVVLSMFKEETEDEPVLWVGGLIGFGSYHYVYASGHEGDAARISFAARKTKLSLYLMDGLQEHEAALARLGTYKAGKSCLHINKLTDVDLTVLREIVRASIVTMTQRYP